MKLIITVKYDVTNLRHDKWEGMSDQEIIEYFGDTPEIIADADFDEREPNIVSKIERIK